MATEARALHLRTKGKPRLLGPDTWELLRPLVDSAPECIKVVAPDGRLLQMNTEGLRLIEAPSWATVENACVFDLIAPEHRRFWRDYHDRVCRGETLTWQFDIVGLAGVRRRMETNAIPVILNDGSIGQLAFTRDITARSEAERELQQVKQVLEEAVSDRTRELQTTRRQLETAQRSLELLFNSVTDYAIFMLDPDGRVMSWNVGARRIKGYEAEEIIGEHFSRFYTEEDRSANLPIVSLETAAREGRVEREGWRVRKDGTRFWANVILHAIREGGQLIGFAKVTRDITEKKASDARLRQAQKMEAIGQFTGGAAHDFSNLLMAISGSLELLRKHLPDDPRMLGLLDNAMQASKRGTSLTQRMLAFARRQELKLEAVDLTVLVNGMQELLERSVGPAIRIDTRLTGPIPCVLTDSNQLETALLNLALNARDAMPSGGTIIMSAQQVRVTAGHPTHLAPGLYTCLSFTDTGQGMDEATLARVTEPFFTTKGVGKGTGLGLAMVDGLCAQSGGKLLIRSRLYQGTTIELWLPATGTEAASRLPSTVGDSVSVKAADRRPLKVLLVDDDHLVLRSTTAMLEDFGHEVFGVPSGESALHILRERAIPFDLVIADQMMPGMTGLQLAREARAVRPGLPILLATGYGELPAGADEILPRLTKPFTQQQLAEATAACVHLERNARPLDCR
jgi:PAS domain S-box-containing protein